MNQEKKGRVEKNIDEAVVRFTKRLHAERYLRTSLEDDNAVNLTHHKTEIILKIKEKIDLPACQ